MAQKLPEEFQNQMKRLLGEAGFFAYLNALDEPYTRALRINLLLRPDGTPPCAIEGLGAPVPWAKGAYFIEGDARPGLSPLHEGGLFYMQEPSALTAVTVLDPQPGERVLDLCAAPGGKSTQIAALMGGQGLLVCNEPVPSRAQILSRNVERMGVRHAVVVSALPDALAPRFPAFFDRILVDAPCSGEGMFRRQPEARDEWHADSPAYCADRQMDILSEAAKMLRPGGVMVYSRRPAVTGKLTGLVSQRQMEKEYLAVLTGHPQSPADTLTDLLFRDAKCNKSYVVSRMRKGVREASLSYEELGRADALSLVCIRLHTGRTHQIRAQFRHAGCPLLGDGKYGRERDNRAYGKKGQALCSWRLKFAFTTPAGTLEYLNGKSFQTKTPEFAEKYFQTFAKSIKM